MCHASKRTQEERRGDIVYTGTQAVYIKTNFGTLHTQLEGQQEEGKYRHSFDRRPGKV